MPVGPGSTVSVGLTLDACGHPVLSIELSIQWDPSVVSLVTVEAGALTGGWLLFQNQPAAGTVSIAMAGISPLSATGEVLSLTFQVTGSAGTSTSLALLNARLNEGNVPVTLQHGQLSVQESAPTSFAIPLSTGWNLCSLPLAPVSGALPDLLASVAGQYTSVCSHEAPDGAGSWECYRPDMPAFVSDLDRVDETDGLWINAREAATLIVEGFPSAVTEIKLLRGWNLVGYPRQTSTNVATALASIEACYDLIYTFAGEAEPATWQAFDPNAQPATNTLTQLDPGRAYWIHVGEDCTWMLP
jgi:hypothetical protein